MPSWFKVNPPYIPSVMMGITTKGRLKPLFGVFQTTFFLTQPFQTIA